MRINFVPLFFLVFILASPLCASQYQFVEINFPGAAETIVTGVSDNGVVVGTYGPNIDVRNGVEVNRKGFIHNPVTGSFESLKPFNSPAVNANSINNSGLVVGDFLSGNNRLHGFVYDTQTSQFVDVLPAGVNADEATISDIDDNGVLIGSFSTNTSLSQPNANSLDVAGFRGVPDGAGGYTFETFEYPLSTSTFGGSRNTSGVEVGTAIVQNVLGSQIFAYARPSLDRFDFPDALTGPDEAVTQTSFASINENGFAIGNTGIQGGSLIDLSLRNQAFLISIDDMGNIDETSLISIDLPCPSCAATLDLSDPANLRFSGAGRSVATNLSNSGMIVGFNDNNDGIFSGFLGILLPEEGLLGDFDSDEDVDGADFLAWQRGDSPNQPGSIDLLAWEINYGTVTQLASVNVPEPEALLLVLIGLITICSVVHHPR